MLFFFNPHWNKYTEDVRQVLGSAVAAGQRDGCGSLTPEYLLVSLLQHTIARRYLLPAQIEAAMHGLDLQSRGETLPPTHTLALSRGVKAILRAAEKLARTKDTDVDIVHVLSGALLARTPMAPLLSASGVSLEALGTT